MSRKSYKVRDDSAALAVYSIVSNRVSSGAALANLRLGAPATGHEGATGAH